MSTTTEFELSRSIFAAKKEMILISGAAKRETQSLAPAGLGFSASRTGRGGPVKFSAVAKVLDYILINNAVRCLEHDEKIYAEISLDSTVYRVLCDGHLHSYEGKRPHNSVKFIPLVLYFLRSKSDKTELKECFQKIKESYDKTRSADLADIAKFCDSFYYSIAKDFGTFTIEEDDLQVATIKAAIRSGDLKPFSSPLDGLEPGIYSAEATYSISEESSGTASKEDQFDAIKKGEKTIPFAWKESQKAKIPSRESLNDFVPCPEYYSILNKICFRMNKVNLRLDSGISGVEAIGKDYINLLMVGKPGTGKTTLAYALGAATGMPVYSISLNKDTESDVFQGMTKVVDGHLDFVSTDFLDAYKNGGIIILEEINLANPNVVMGTIGQSIEYPFILMENGYKPVRRHPLCVIIGTMNVGTYGSAGLNEALSSRFKTTYELNDPQDEDFIRILEKSGGTKKACKWVLGIYKKILNFLMSPSVNAEDVCMRLTMRGCIGALEGIEEGETPKQAIRRTLIGKIAESDLELANKVWEDVQNLPDLK